MKQIKPMNPDPKGSVKVSIVEDQKVVVVASGWAQVHLILAMPFSIPSLYGCPGDSA